MGIIKRQAISGTIITFIAVVIGFITTSFLLPQLSTEIVGLINILISYTVVLTVFGRLGFGQVTTRLFSYFRDKDNNHNGFMFIGIVITLIGFLLTIGIIFLIQYFFILNRPPDDLFLKYLLFLIPLVFFLLFFYLFDQYYKVNFKSVRGTFLKELVQKIFTLIAVSIMVYGAISVDIFVLLYVTAFSIPGIIIVGIAISEKQVFVRPKPNFINNELKKNMILVGLFGIISGATGIVALNIDRMMIESMSGLSDTGIYSIAFYFGSLIAIPSRSILKISSAVIAESWKNNDLSNLKIVYYKSSINQFIIGGLLFIGIIINLDNIFILLTDKYISGRYVIIFIALAFLFDMISGASSQIIGNSKYFKYQSYLLIGFVILVVVTNYLLIPKYGITGAALATLISKTIYNLSKIITVKLLFNLQPFNHKYIYILLVSILIILLNSIIPVNSNFIFDIVIRSSIVSIVYLGAIYFLKISEDVNKIIDSLIKR